eukprot:UN00355
MFASLFSDDFNFLKEKNSENMNLISCKIII